MELPPETVEQGAETEAAELAVPEHEHADRTRRAKRDWRNRLLVPVLLAAGGFIATGGSAAEAAERYRFPAGRAKAAAAEVGDALEGMQQKADALGAAADALEQRIKAMPGSERLVKNTLRVRATAPKPGLPGVRLGRSIAMDVYAAFPDASPELRALIGEHQSTVERYLDIRVQLP